MANRALVDRILNDPSEIQKLTDEEVQTAHRAMNPYGYTSRTDEKYLVFSQTLIQEKYSKRFRMTSLVGFLYQMLKENEFDNLAEGVAPEVQRAIVRRFLDKYLCFNVSDHVRRATKFRDSVKDASKTTEQQKVDMRLTEEKMKKHDMPIPPMDTFHRWNYYEDVNYEVLRELTEMIYPERTLFENAIQPIEVFDSKEEADKYVAKKQDNFVTELLTVSFGYWSFVDAWSENRKNIKFDNKRTQVLKGIMDQAEENAKLGQELLNKRMINKKKQNIKDAGPDAKGLKSHIANNNLARTLGAETLSKEERDRIEAEALAEREAAGLSNEPPVSDFAPDPNDGTDITVTKPATTPVATTTRADNVTDAPKPSDDDKWDMSYRDNIPEGAIAIDTFVHDPETGKMKHQVIYTEAVDPE